MGAMTTTANRSDVSSYRLDRGRFVVGDPLISVVASFYGVGSAAADASWRSLNDGASMLFDAGDAGVVWPTCGYPYGELRMPSDAVDHIVDGAMGDRASARRYRAARMSAGWRAAMPLLGTDDAWLIVAMKPPPGTDGAVASMTCGTTPIGVGIEGDRYRILLGGGTQALRARSISGDSPVVVGIAALPTGAKVLVRDGRRTTVHQWETTSRTNVSSAAAGGDDSADVLLYAIACGTAGGFEEMMDAMIGYLAC